MTDATFLERIRRLHNEYDPYYEAPPGDLKRYDQNVNLLGPHPAVRTPDYHADRVHLYPNRDNRPLLEALGRAHNLGWDRHWVGNGSDDVIDLVMRLFAEPGQRVVVPTPTYSMYPHLARLNRLAYVGVPTDHDFQITASKLLAQKPDLIIVCNPNNPTGTMFDPSLVGELLDSFDGPVLVDEAYAEFAGTTTLALVDKYPNLLVSRTLSKAYGLAGLRIGYGVAHPDVAELARRAKPPFSLNTYSETVAVAALADKAPVERTIATVSRERERLTEGLRRIGFTVWPSHANFVLTLPPIPADELHATLKERNILARLYRQEPALRDHIRFTVGGPDDTDELLGALQRIVGPRQNEEEADAS